MAKPNAKLNPILDIIINRTGIALMSNYCRAVKIENDLP